MTRDFFVKHVSPILDDYTTDMLWDNLSAILRDEEENDNAAAALRASAEATAEEHPWRRRVASESPASQPEVA